MIYIYFLKRERDIYIYIHYIYTQIDDRYTYFQPYRELQFNRCRIRGILQVAILQTVNACQVLLHKLDSSQAANDIVTRCGLWQMPLRFQRRHRRQQ